MTGDEIDEVERLFAPAMDKAVAIFKEWSTTRRLLNDLLDRVNNTPDDVLMMSRFNCHAHGVASIVLRTDKAGRMERVFIADVQSLGQDDDERGPVSVGYHNHQYDLKITTLAGIVNQVTVCEYLSTPCDDTSCFFPMYKWMVGSNRLSPEVEIVRVGMTSMQRVECVQLNVGVTHYLPAKQIHSIAVKSPIAIWKIDQDLPKIMCTDLYTRSTSINTKGLYIKPDSPKVVRDYVASQINIAKSM